MLDLSHEPDLGYIFYPNDTAHHPGHPRLDVIIPAVPTYHHYDPHLAQFFVVSPTGDVEHLRVHHPWPSKTKYRVCAGRIILLDRQGKQVEAFTFGGDLQIYSDEKQTVCALTSDAPIFPLFTTQDLPMWIVCQCEILLAQQKAHWDPQHPHDFQAHLAVVEPFLLYASCLQTLEDEINHLHTGAEGIDRQGVHFVQGEIARLRKMAKWPILLPALDQLL